MEQYIRNQDMLYGYIVSLLPRHADADDVFQETSLVLWEKHESFDQDRSFVAWSYGIARNVALSYVRKKRNQGHTFSPDLFASVEEARIQSNEMLQKQSEFLQHCLARLPEKHRSFVMQCYSNQGSMSSVASQLGVSENALYLRLSRIRRRLFDCMRRFARSEEMA